MTLFIRTRATLQLKSQVCILLVISNTPGATRARARTPRPMATEVAAPPVRDCVLEPPTSATASVSSRVVASSTAYKAAGVLPFSRTSDGEILVLLGGETRGERRTVYYSDFGGKREDVDGDDPTVTAGR